MIFLCPFHTVITALGSLFFCSLLFLERPHSFFFSLKDYFQSEELAFCHLCMIQTTALQDPLFHNYLILL